MRPHAPAITVHPGGSGDPHVYFIKLTARSDCRYAYSLRDAQQVQQLASDGGLSGDFAYLYPNDPDPRRQDAMRIRIKPGYMGPEGKIIAPIGPTNGQHLFFVFDFWMAHEWRYDLSLLQGHKNCSPFAFTVQGQGETTWFGTNTNYRNALQYPENQLPGGPYIAMPFPMINVGGHVKTPTWWRDHMDGFPRAMLPYGATHTRQYEEAIQRFDQSVYPQGAECGLVAERRHRVWHYFERAPEEDWVSEKGPQAAYRWSMWFADALRPPLAIVRRGVIGIPTASLGFKSAVMCFGSGNANLPAKDVVRGDLVAYCADVVALHGTSDADALALLSQEGLN